MARPRSDDKRSAIIQAAVQALAQGGITASTASIAKLAGVSEGSIFTYFATKDDLLNQVYLVLKAEFRSRVQVGYPDTSSSEAKMRHVWMALVNWGISNPDGRKAMRQLTVSDKITPETRQQAAQGAEHIYAFLSETMGTGVGCCPTRSFAGSIMSALVDTTMEYMVRDPEQASQYAESGFQAFWRAIAAR